MGEASRARENIIVRGRHALLFMRVTRLFSRVHVLMKLDIVL